ncbi:MAG: sodium/solute symporter [Bacteroidetes Order II. Incertae sedis bacterium]|jgi:solute:Na+ symporter, SSS family|nr:sodium/solute symporter [Bacteroidetes Order II. bacterium]MBT4051492.1 sodium/solute symporter [Bacteroidetes Order II. bacterium]MBT4601671.1 sodium/solute symporter [Bacteroidetes Order II. bacterium]MBT5249156.1 sodium/solute symporter [Bacteroidetes Order II. bacterium]MBT6199518.1 sodium/solute symporter [Bacteroidetes Order II. bacterium]
MTNLDIAIVVFYMVGIMAIGIYAGYRKNTSSKQFFLAGKSLRWPVIGAALFTANISTIHLVGLAADGYRIGFVVGNFEWMATFTLIVLGLIFVPFYLRSNITTLPEFLEKRYSPTPRLIMALITVVSALLIHIGISIYAGAMVFLYFFGIPVIWSVIGIALVAATYTIIGGLRAIMITDAIQAVLLLTGAVVLTLFAIFALPDQGIHSMADLQAAVKSDQMNMLHSFRNPETGRLNEYSWVSVLLGYPILGIWYWCTDQTIVQKTLGARSMRDGQLGAVFAGGLKILPLFFMVLPGVLGYVLFQDIIEQPNETLLVMIQELLPAGLKGLLAAGLLAAVMSTVESALNSTATVVAEDIVKKIRPQTTDKALVTIGRITAGVVIVLAVFWSPFGGKFESIFEAINKIPMMFAPAITCVFLFGVFWKRGTKEAAVTTLLFGLTIGIVYFLVDLPAFGDTRLVADDWGIPFMQVGWWLFCLCSVVYVATSLLTPAPPDEQLKAIHWQPPMKVLLESKLGGWTDPRSVSIGLFALMAILYFILR